MGIDKSDRRLRPFILLNGKRGKARNVCTPTVGWCFFLGLGAESLVIWIIVTGLYHLGRLSSFRKNIYFPMGYDYGLGGFL